MNATATVKITPRWQEIAGRVLMGLAAPAGVLDEIARLADRLIDGQAMPFEITDPLLKEK